MSSYNRQIINNSLFSLVQIVVVTALTFILYKYIIEILGLEKLGLWSLILSVTSLANIGNLGFTGSLIKFSAELSAEKEFAKINAILNTSIVGVSIIAAVLLLGVYVIGYNTLDFFVEDKWLESGRTLLSFALLSLYLNILSGLYFSILEGLNMAYLRSLAFIISTICYVVSAIFFANEYDIIGLAYAQILQATLFLVLGITLSLRFVKGFRIFYFKWHKKLMIEVFNYGVNFQIMGIAQMLYDPITKSILSRYGGLDFVAIFEMTSKLVRQVRMVPAAILQNIVPKIVTLNVTKGSNKVKEAYKRINNINLFLLFSSVFLLIPLSKIFSIILLDETNASFVISLIILSFGWAINSLNIPAYMVNLGTGHLKWNVVGHVIIGILNLVLCFLIGYFFENGIYITIGWIASLIVGSSIIVLEYHKRNGMALSSIFNQLFFKLLGCYLVLGVLSYLISVNINGLIPLILSQAVLILLYLSFLFLNIKEVKENVGLIYNTRKKI